MTADADIPEAPNAGSAEGMHTQDDHTFQVLAQYVKDLSFEAPNTPQVFNAIQEKAPDINVNIDVGASQLQEGAYEVTLRINAECKADGKNAFVLELVYAGLVRANLTPETLRPALLIETPRHLFPFARNIVSDVTRDGGFQPLMLAPMDFVAMYEQNAKAGATPNAADATPPADA